MSKKWIIGGGEEVKAQFLNQTGANFRAYAKDPAVMKVSITDGVLLFAGSVIKYAGGDSPTIVAPVSNPRIDLIVIDRAGTVSVVAGTEAGSPAAPSYPVDKYVIAEIYLKVGATEINDTDEGNSYILRDSRPIALLENSTIRAFLAGEDLVKGNPCFIADGLTWYEKFIQDQGAQPSTSYSIYGTNRGGQTFTTKQSPYGSIVLTEFKVFLTKDGTPPGNLNLDIYAVDASDNPTGASLATSTIAASASINQGWTSFNFSLSLAANTKYIAVLTLPSGVGTANAVRWWSQVGGAALMIDGEHSFNSGSWQVGYQEWFKFQVKYSYIYGTTGRAYISRGDRAERGKTQMLSLEAISAGNACLFQLADIAVGLSGLSAGADYFVEDNARSIASQQGTNNSEQGVQTSDWIAQTFDTDANTDFITKVRLSLKRGNNPTGAVTVSIRATSSDLPTGADLGAKTLQNFPQRFDNSTSTDLDIEFDTPIAVSPSTRYAVVIRISGGSGGNTLAVREANTSVYANGRECTSANSGSSWTGQTRDLVFTIFGHSSKGISLAPTDGLYINRIGFAPSTTELLIDKKRFTSKISDNLKQHLQIPAATTYEVARIKLPYIPSKISGLLMATWNSGPQTGKAFINYIPRDNYTLVFYAYGTSVGGERNVGELLEENLNWQSSSANAKLALTIENRELVMSVINDTGGAIDLNSGSFALFLEI